MPEKDMPEDVPAGTEKGDNKTDKLKQDSGDNAAELLHKEAVESLSGANKSDSPKSKCSDGDAGGNDRPKCGGDSFGQETGRQHIRPFEATAEEIGRAAERLEEEVSKLIPEGDRTTLLGMQKAILTGNLDDFQNLLKRFAGRPDDLTKFIDELEKSFKDAHAGIHVARSADGSVLIFQDRALSCLKIAPDSGNCEIRPIRQRFDGTAVLEPGEVIGMKFADLMKQIGNEAVENIVYPFHQRAPQPDFPNEIKPYPQQWPPKFLFPLPERIVPVPRLPGPSPDDLRPSIMPGTLRPLPNIEPEAQDPPQLYVPHRGVRPYFPAKPYVPPSHRVPELNRGQLPRFIPPAKGDGNQASSARR